jgi:3-phenylpropionate/trans-cinnamate dioxygenase ferredoxin reductase component
MSAGVAIAGGGLAGQRCAEALRRAGYEEPIRMICGEAHRPYDRPPLSKRVLFDADAEEKLCFRGAEWYEQQAVELRLGVRACELEAGKRLLHLSDGSELSYEQLLIATGGRPRRLAMFDGYDNVTALRTLEDARRLRHALVPGARLLVIGGGFIGQEAASAARAAGAQASIVEAGPAPLATVLGADIGGWFAELHRSEGVELFLEQRVVSVIGERRVGSVTLDSGATLACDHVLVGVGIEPDLDWLRGSDLDPDGVRTDVDGRSDVPGIYAAGDAAAAYEPLLGRHVLDSHWESAGRQGTRAAKAMLGLDPGPPTIGSFWSDLHGTRVQYLGQASLADDVSYAGDPSSREFSATFTREQEPVAVLLAGRPDMLPQARALLQAATERTLA